jgi:hypothetical protein
MYMGCGIYTEWSPVAKENVQCGFPSMEVWEVVCCHEFGPGMMYVPLNTVPYKELYAAAFAQVDKLENTVYQSVAAAQPNTEPVGGGRQIEPSRPLDLNLESADGNTRKGNNGKSKGKGKAAPKEQDDFYSRHPTGICKSKKALLKGKGKGKGKVDNGGQWVSEGNSKAPR